MQKNCTCAGAVGAATPGGLCGSGGGAKPGAEPFLGLFVLGRLLLEAGTAAALPRDPIDGEIGI